MLILVAALAAPPSPRPHAPPLHQAIVVSFDALNVHRALTTVSPRAIPHFMRLLAQGACAEGARPAFPSLTAVSHASLWTGVYGAVNGVGDNSNIQIPLAAHALTDVKTGFDASQLRAEPIWITAARQGVGVVAHNVTQAPDPPGRLHPYDDATDSLRVRDVAALQRRAAVVVNGYNRTMAPARLLSDSTVALHDAPQWKGMPQGVRATVPPMEMEWDAGPVHLYALFTGTRSYDRVIVSANRDARTGVVLRPHAEDRAAIGTRPLARFFARPLAIASDSGTVYINLRLFELAPDASTFMLFQAESNGVEANDSATGSAYMREIGGEVGNAPTSAYKHGDFGPTLMNGGDGRAEYRYLETIELVARQGMRGSTWLRARRRPRLQLEYSPIIDEIDHLWFGWTDRGTSLDRETAARVQSMRARGWSIADRQLAQLQRQAAAPGTLLVVVSDHGMRPYHRLFRVNAVLRDAGLLVVDAAGKIDLARTQAISAAGHFISINRVGRPEGVVTAGEERSVIAQVRAALLGARSPEGTPIVTRLFEPAADDSLGIGGPNGGDLYFGLADGYGFSSSATGDITDEVGVSAGHGYPSIEPDMYATFCAAGGRVVHQRLPVVRTIDAAPTVARWLGIDAPADSRGRSLLAELLHHP